MYFQSDSSENTLFCGRCSVPLFPGRGGFFKIKFTAVADPYPPILDDQDLKELQLKYRELLRKLDETSATVAMESVAVTRVFQLCNTCFKTWLECPSG
jgi:hypothetical protein